MANRLFSLFRNLFHRSVVEQELDEELRTTVDILIEEKVRQGVPPDKACRQALIELGGVEQVKESVWSAKSGRLLLDLWRDLRFGVRLLRKHPGFTAAAILTLALGIGANTAIFSAMNGILLQPLPYPDSSRLIVIDRPVTAAQFREILQECPALQQIASYDPTYLRLTGGMQNMLYEIKPNDPGTFTGVAILLILAALAACYIPARQAAKSDPMTALRNE